MRRLLALSCLAFLSCTQSDLPTSPKVARSNLTLSTLISSGFEDGTISPFGAWVESPGGLSVTADPTSSGRGDVARFHYNLPADDPRCIPGGCDNNVALVAPLTQRFGETVYFRGEFYFDVPEMMPNGEEDYQRKLLYIKSHEDWTKYPTTGGHRFRLVLGTMGTDLYYNFTFEDVPGNSDAGRVYAYLPLNIQPRRWYTLENRLTMESSIGAGDGVWQVWLDGTLLFEKHDLLMTYPPWLNDEALSDIYLDQFLVGEQVNRFGSGFDEYRYWDNVSFTPTRLGEVAPPDTTIVPPPDTVIVPPDTTTIPPAPCRQRGKSHICK